MLQFSNPSRTVQDNWEKRKEQVLLLFGQMYRDPSYIKVMHPTLCPVHTTNSENMMENSLEQETNTNCMLGIIQNAIPENQNNVDPRQSAIQSLFRGFPFT